jgi:uncharacterized protein YecT (DUF1311 family)
MKCRALVESLSSMRDSSVLGWRRDNPSDNVAISQARLSALICIERHSMLRSVLAIPFVLIVANVPLAQQSAKPAAQPARANPCDNATTQAEMNQCTAEEYRKADAHLNIVYKNLVRLLQKDADQPQQPSGGEQKKAEIPAVQKLRAAQRQWIQYRDLHCGAVKAQYEGGTIAAMQWSPCMTETTNHRAEELKHGYQPKITKSNRDYSLDWRQPESACPLPGQFTYG